MILWMYAMYANKLAYVTAYCNRLRSSEYVHGCVVNMDYGEAMWGLSKRGGQLLVRNSEVKVNAGVTYRFACKKRRQDGWPDAAYREVLSNVSNSFDLEVAEAIERVWLRVSTAGEPWILGLNVDAGVLLSGTAADLQLLHDSERWVADRNFSY